MTPKWAVGMEKIGPGIYVKGRELHIDTQGICRALGIPHTAANARMVNAEAVKAVRQVCGPIPTESRYHPE